MKKLMVLSVVILFSCISCEKLTINGDVPYCMKSKIREFSNSDFSGEGTKVDLYIFQKENVYVFYCSNNIDDGADVVIDENCNSLGGLGGIGLIGEINGVNFYENATYQKTVWKYEE